MARAQAADDDAARELELYAENDHKLYQQRAPFLENMRKKMAKGKYDPAKGVKLWEYYVERAARQYTKEFGSGRSPIFSPATRRIVAKRFEEEARRELRGR